MAIKTSTFSISRLSNIYPNRDFWHEKHHLATLLWQLYLTATPTNKFKASYLKSETTKAKLILGKSHQKHSQQHLK
jgi:hypothetical protein